MPAPSRSGAVQPDLAALEAITTAVASGAGLPEVVRAAAKALDASVIVIDRASSVLAVAARSSADERALMADAAGVETHELRVGDADVGRLRLRGRAGSPPEAFVRVVATFIASEVERLRAPERASRAAQETFLRAVLERSVTDRGDIRARAEEVGVDVTEGSAIVVVRAHHYGPVSDDWRGRILAAAERAARSVSHGSLAAVLEPTADTAGSIVVLIGGGDEAVVRRVAEGIARELQASLQGFTFAVGCSRIAADPVDIHRAGHEALLAANVAETHTAGADGPPAGVLSFEDTGAYRLLLRTLTDDPGELHRFYGETVEPLVAYDDQYETDLVQTLETFLESDGNVAGTAQKLFTHRHTVRYRLERARDLTGLDVASTDGRERLGLGLKAMRVLGIAAPRGPATEPGAGAGKVPRESDDR